MEEVIYDREQSDVSLVQLYIDRINENGYSSLSADEKALWEAGMKGAYCYIDLNRVGRVTNYIANLLNTYSYKNNVVAKTNWIITDIPTQEQLSKYITDIATLKNIYYSKTDTPLMPTNFNLPTITKANAIEKILFDINDLIEKMTAEFRKSGTFYSGGMEGLI